MLSRRLKLGATRSKTEPTTPASEPEDPADCPELHFHDVAPAQAKRKRRYTWLVFAIGGLAGLLLAGAAAKNQDMISMELLRELSLDSFIDRHPAVDIGGASVGRVTAAADGKLLVERYQGAEGGRDLLRRGWAHNARGGRGLGRVARMCFESESMRG